MRKASAMTTDLTLSLFLPLIYVVLHIIVQPHRFDLSTGFGCTASIHTSTLSIIFIWIPPMVLSLTTFVYTFLAVKARLDSGLFFFSHMQDAPRISALTFIRPLALSVFICLANFAVTIFSMAAHLISVGGLQAWTVETWDEVHAGMSQVFVIPASSHLELARVEAEWWAIPACTLVFFAMTGLAFVSGFYDERSQTYGALPHWFRRVVLRRRPSSPSSWSKGLSGQTLCSTPSSPASMYEMKSGWDDTWRPAAPAKVKLAPLTIPDMRPHSIVAVSDQDESFVQSTITYIESPTGREALGLPPLQPAFHPPAPAGGSATPTSLPPATRSSPKEDLRRSVSPLPNGLLSGPWPQPPSTIPSSPRTPSPKTPVTVSPPTPTSTSVLSTARPPSVLSVTPSFASSGISVDPYAYDDGPHVVPFQDSTAGAAGVAPGLGLAVPQHIRKARSRDVLLPRSLSTGSRGRRNGSDGGLSGGIYMTVVRETD
ncbi:pheromone A receptor-domain-containing protein [Trametes elegans]|nr:pheromone A receptor-domain-containing protein [Trametes elegans]